ncbi:hypothetical protein [Evansella cellulosilytica]|uniref:Uncharacterized protein n=1 Tax=Evansella cellulosilytica (strain ATCC 21833 / DSM 2522 / FERM P-1141 / JCM 9156 / N-4) TaxID=649639 RepID=E6TQJ5_EVAC2|nr:hypothetical protein [Evansella cellulosilytica]ADU30506.1 hypothetical protein Bcell_2246 [Evansella cellulosilytica DSM 2522]
MFDPTIYDNLKVVLEGKIYEHDFSGDIIITNREDIVDLATMSRMFSIKFTLASSQFKHQHCELVLSSTMEDFATEMLDENEHDAGCSLYVYFHSKIRDVEKDCSTIQRHLNMIWNGRPMITQKVSFLYGNDDTLLNETKLHFNRKINEEQIQDVPSLLDYCIQSLTFFHKHYKRSN